MPSLVVLTVALWFVGYERLALGVLLVFLLVLMVQTVMLTYRGLSG